MPGKVDTLPLRHKWLAKNGDFEVAIFFHFTTFCFLPKTSLKFMMKI
jgi:hypothetical protein